MRDLTPGEQQTLADRRGRFDTFLAERMPVLAEFAEDLGAPEPLLIVAEPSAFISLVDAFMQDQVVEPEHRIWILTRLGYFFGELLVERFGGCWLINEVPESRTFLRFVVGCFARIDNASAMVDPFEVMDAYLAKGPGRDLAGLLDEVERELKAA